MIRFSHRYPVTVDPLPPVLLKTTELSLEKLDPLDLLPLLDPEVRRHSPSRAAHAAI